MNVITRGFTGRTSDAENPGRLPPGQYLERGFPVMSAGPTPDVPEKTWRFTITTETGHPRTWNWDEFTALPAEDVTTDIHCVTNWTKLDTLWRGVSLDTLLAGIDTDAKYVLAESADGYTTNLPLADLRDHQAWLAYAFDGRPIDPEHGGPVRLLVPHLYFWKSAKWVTGLRLMNTQEQGFWENLGYHDYGDPWREQRYRDLDWLTATVAATRVETATARTLTLDVPGWPDHLPGQHVDVRLRAMSGYTAQRSYSIASAPEPGRFELTVQRIEGGELSPWLTGVATAGDQFEICGPIGGGFTWDPEEALPPVRPGSRGPDTRPLLLVAGGSGIVPIMSIIRSNSRVPARLIYSVRHPADIIYASYLGGFRGVVPPGQHSAERPNPSLLRTAFCYTRSAPEGEPVGRITAAIFTKAGFRAADNPDIYICGPTGFVETAAALLIELGHDPSGIRTERFGPTGS